MKIPHPQFYILDGEKRVIPARDVIEWGHFFESAARIVEQTDVGDVRVSTVFLGFDHRLFGDGPPLVFETMIFGGPLNDEQWRYSSWDDAETGHAVAVKKARKALRAQPGVQVAITRGGE
ncbi:MAG TPA: hypothetical protein VHY10_05215 [Xanthobacteraceae bacterium]|nr:hypothetical protein [Xanthobacteraceae bacterium]